MNSDLASVPSPDAVIVGPRHFNAAQADSALVLIRRIVRDVMDEYDGLVELQETIEAAEYNRHGQIVAAAGSEGEADLARDRLAVMAMRLHGYLEELDEVGAELRDWAVGVVDFPCVAGGREVRLCWRWGEKRIGHWHEVGACPYGRRPISTLPVADGLPLEANLA